VGPMSPSFVRPTALLELLNELANLLVSAKGNIMLLDALRRSHVVGLFCCRGRVTHLKTSGASGGRAGA
jgi:hypothetical protein